MDEQRFIPLVELVRAVPFADAGDQASECRETAARELVGGVTPAAVSNGTAVLPPTSPAPDTVVFDSNPPAYPPRAANSTPLPTTFSPLTSESDRPGTAQVASVPEVAMALREARLFRAALADTFDRMASNLALALAEQVLGRELQLAPADLRTIAAGVLAQSLRTEPLRIRVSPDDAAVALELPVVVDAELRPGDAILECRLGGIDARLSVRLAQAIASVAW